MRAPTDRQARLARNQSLYREVNERIAAFHSGSANPTLHVVCECANTDCAKTFDVTPAEYESVRTLPTRFLVLDGHVYPEVEDVVETFERFVVVEKVEVGAEVAATLYSRAA